MPGRFRGSQGSLQEQKEQGEKRGDVGKKTGSKTTQAVVRALGSELREGGITGGLQATPQQRILLCTGFE